MVISKFCMLEKLLERLKRKSFLHRIVTGVEKWIHYDNPKRKKSHVKPCQFDRKTEYPWRKVNDLYLVWSEECAVLWAAKIGWNYQWRSLPKPANPFEKSNSRKTPGICNQAPWHSFPSRQRSAPCAIPVENYLENNGWDSPYSPDIAPSDYHLFRSMQNTLTEIQSTSVQGIRNWLDSILAAKPAQFFWDGIHKLSER